MKYIVATRRGRLNVRSGPGLNNSVISKLNKGSIVQISETRQAGVVWLLGVGFRHNI
ncbi:MAG: SH3 domain-containing protein [Candidatus Thiodiazotropha endolucinida]